MSELLKADPEQETFCLEFFCAKVGGREIQTHQNTQRYTGLKATQIVQVYDVRKKIQNMQEVAKYFHFFPERLRDSIEEHMGQKGIFWCSFVPKYPKLVKKWPTYGNLRQKCILWWSFVPERSKIGQEIAELGLFSPERLRDSIEKHMGQKGFLWCPYVPKRSKIGQDMAELWSLSH